MLLKTYKVIVSIAWVRKRHFSDFLRFIIRTSARR